ncbi:MAG: class II fructose-bisphosphate aldolase [Negativicutes bacterium]|jgi:ketose-bisphosphate aldolase
MALVSANEILIDAQKHGYAVGAFNVFNIETLSAVVEVAEELKSPVIIGVPERLFKFVDVEILSAAMVKSAHKAHVPVALHLDHGFSYEGVMKALRWGFTSIMYDGSNLPFDDNMRKTREIRRMAHALGVTVEAELDYTDCYCNEEPTFSQYLIHNSKVREYLDKTKVDSLAVTFGKHGPAGSQYELQVDYEKLFKLREVAKIPLVLHGAPKLKPEEYVLAIKAGIAKINVPTDTSYVEIDVIKKELAQHPHANLIHLMTAVKKGVKESVKKYMLAFNSVSKIKKI